MLRSPFLSWINLAGLTSQNKTTTKRTTTRVFLEGSLVFRRRGFSKSPSRRVARSKGHCLVVVAEGCGDTLLKSSGEVDGALASSWHAQGAHPRAPLGLQVLGFVLPSLPSPPTQQNKVVKLQFCDGFAKVVCFLTLLVGGGANRCWAGRKAIIYNKDANFPYR